MKKIALLSILLCLTANNLMAKFQDQTACNESEIKWLINNKQYLDINSPYLDLGVTKTLIDTKTIKIDRKNKTIDVNLFYVANKYKRSLMASDYGLDQGHVIFNYEKRTRKSGYSDRSACNGDIIHRIDLSDIGEDNLPAGSLDTSAMDAIVKIYHLE